MRNRLELAWRHLVSATYKKAPRLAARESYRVRRELRCAMIPRCPLIRRLPRNLTRRRRRTGVIESVNRVILVIRQNTRTEK